MIPNILSKTISGVWPMIFIFSIILVSLRLTFLIVNKKKIVFYKELLSFFFIIYILILYYIVTYQDVNYGNSNFIPFKEIFRYDVGSRLFIRNVIGNIVLFIPLGVYVGCIIKSKTFIPSFIISFLVSISIEFAQYMIGRIADVDDVILNTIGGVFGYVSFKYLNRFIDKHSKSKKLGIILNVISVILVLIIVYLLYKMKIWEIVSWIK